MVYCLLRPFDRTAKPLFAFSLNDQELVDSLFSLLGFCNPHLMGDFVEIRQSSLVELPQSLLYITAS